MTEQARFPEQVEPYRAELQLHCYRILGSLHDAEDAVQETLFSAWKSLDTFEGRSSMRTWLYRIATNRCLNMLRDTGRRPREAESEMAEVELPEPTRMGEVLWLEPYPDSFLEGIADAMPGPEALYETKESVSLAFIVALQVLPPRQRAVLILRDVLGYHATEVAHILDSSQESVTSALKRARAALRMPHQSSSPVDQAVVGRFTRAFESSDLDGVIELLAEEVWFTMPPLSFEWKGRKNAARFLDAMWHGTRRKLVPTRANGQPAFGLYLADPHAEVLHCVGLLVLSLDGDRISAITRFDTGALSHFGLPRTVPASLR